MSEVVNTERVVGGNTGAEEGPGRPPFQGAVETRRAVEDVTRAPLEGIKVFVIDDDPAMRQLNTMLAGAKGAKVMGSYDLAFTFFEQVKSGEVDVDGATIITDHDMSWMDGCTLARKLHELYPDRTYKIVIVSGGGETVKRTAENLIDDGALDAFVKKPFDLKDFLEIVASVNGRNISQ